MHDSLKKFHHKKLLILGFAREGRSLFTFLKSKIPTAELIVADTKKLHQLEPESQTLLSRHKTIKLLTGQDYPKNPDEFDYIFRSPGVSPYSDFLVSAAKQKKLTSETRLFFDLFPGTIIGISGTKGKSTTSKLIYEILHQAKREVFLVGNIGVPSISILRKASIQTIAVFELSSHQLFDLHKSPHIAVMLNIFPEHLDYYPSFQAYTNAKANLVNYQHPQDYLVYDPHQPILTTFDHNCKAQKITVSDHYPPSTHYFIKNDKIYRHSDHPKVVISASDIPLIGEHNVINVMHAIAASSILDISTIDQRAVIKKFKSLPHRLEYVGSYNHILYYNDSLATNPQAAIQAIKSLPLTRTLIIGGQDRGVNLQPLVKAVRSSLIQNLIILARDPQRYLSSFNQLSKSIQILTADTMKQAVTLAQHHTPPHSICLLSPGAPSFDLFTSYRERGELFKQFVQQFS